MRTKLVTFFENENNEKKILGILFILTFIVNIWFIGESKMIYMSGDEMGPIATAAYLCGQDWSSVMESIGAYYSYGYSLLLYPLFLISNTATGFYRMAIFLNVILTASIVPISYFIGKRLCPTAKREYLYIVSFAVANFITNIGRSQSAWCETLLIFMYWCLILNFILLEEQINYKRVFLGAVLSMYTYMVHQRTLGILIAYMMALVILCILKKTKLRYLICYFVSVAIIFVCHSNIKTFVQANVWGMGLTTSSNVNDYSGVLQNLQSRASENILEYIEKLLYAFCGHLYYISATTLGLAILALIIIIVICWRGIIKIRKGEKNSDGYLITYLFVGLSFFATLSISVLFMTPAKWEHYGRSDQLIYGRYTETVLGILIYIAILFLLENKIKKRYVFADIVISIVIAFITSQAFGRLESLSYQRICIVGLSGYYENGKMDFFTPTILTIFVLLAFYADKNKQRKIFYTVVISVFWIVTGLNYFREYILPMEQNNYKYTELIEKKEELNKQCDFYYYGNDSIKASFVQFLLKDKQSLIVERDFSNIPQGVFYGLTYDVSFLLDNENLNIIDGVNGLYLFTNEGQTGRLESGVNLPLKMFGSNFDIDMNENAEFTNDGNAGYLMYGPYITLDEGDYQVSIDYSSVGTGQSSYVDVCSMTTQTVYAKQELTMTEGKMNEINLDISLKDPVENMEIRVYTAEGEMVVINEVLIDKIN